MTPAFLFALAIVALGFYLTRPVDDAAEDRPHLRIRQDLRLRARMVFALRKPLPT